MLCVLYRLIAVGDPNHCLHVYDIRQTSSPIRSLSLHESCNPVAVTWDPSNRYICVNGQSCIVTVDMVQEICEGNGMSILNVQQNQKYPRNCIFQDGYLITGDDSGSISVHGTSATTSLSICIFCEE